MTNTKRIPVVTSGRNGTGATLSVLEGPTYMRNTPDGPVEHIGQFVVAQLPDGSELFQHFDWRDDANDRIEAIEAYGSINAAKWSDRHPWGNDRMLFTERFAPFGPEWEREQRERMEAN